MYSALLTDTRILYYCVSSLTQSTLKDYSLLSTKKATKKEQFLNSIYLVFPQLSSISSPECNWPITAFFHSNYIILDFLSYL